LEVLEDRSLLSSTPAIGTVFYIDMENHNLTQPSSMTDPPQLLGNSAAPYLNSLMTPGAPNAAQSSYASNYGSTGVHPSEPNYLWQEQGTDNGVANDNLPYGPGGNYQGIIPSLTGLLQAAGVSWKSYQEDIDLTPGGGSVNLPYADSLTSDVAPQSQWTVPLNNFSGTSTAYTNPYNGSHQYDFATKHDGQLYFKATNGGNNTTPANPEAAHYAPLQQLQTDLTNDTAARYNVITPDQFNDMHTPLSTDFTYHGVTYPAYSAQAAVAQGDNFLSQVVPKIMASQAYKNNGAIVIWFDETEGGDSADFTLPEVVLSPLARGNAYASTLAYTHSSDLKSMQELFGVSAPGGAGAGGAGAGSGFLGDANQPGTHDLWDLFKPGPQITQAPTDQTVVAGQSVTFTAAAKAAIDSDPAPTVQWQVSTDGGSHFTDIPGATSTTLTFTTDATQDRNQYQAVFANTIGTTTTDVAHLTAQFAPELQQSPTSLTYKAGQVVSFTAAARAEPLAVQWQVSTDAQSFHDLPGATTPTLTFTADKTTKNTLYQAVFTNDLGHVTSSIAFLGKVPAALIGVVSPRSQTIKLGKAVTFTAGDKLPGLEVQWQSSTDGGVTFQDVPGATAPALTFTPTAADNGTHYRALLSHLGHALSTTAATLSIRGVAPAVTVDLEESETAQVGQTVSLIAEASGSSKLTVQWQVSTDGGATFKPVSKKRLPGYTASSVSRTLDATGKLHSTLTFTADGSEANFVFRAVFKNSKGSADSAGATLLVSGST
jgi:hypothetical protein